MEYSPSLEFLDSGEPLGSWATWDEEPVISHMDNTTPSFSSEFYNQGEIIDFPLLGANTLTSLRSETPVPGEAAHSPTISATTHDDGLSLRSETPEFGEAAPSPTISATTHDDGLCCPWEDQEECKHQLTCEDE